MNKKNNEVVKTASNTNILATCDINKARKAIQKEHQCLYYVKNVSHAAINEYRAQLNTQQLSINNAQRKENAKKISALNTAVDNLELDEMDESNQDVQIARMMDTIQVLENAQDTLEMANEGIRKVQCKHFKHAATQLSIQLPHKSSNAKFLEKQQHTKATDEGFNR